jgi:predicted transcriptional regulator
MNETTMKATEIARIVEQLRGVQEGPAWHGPSVREALEGVTAAAAARRPLAAGHTIWEIVHHIRVTDETVRAHVAGETAGQEPDWPAPGDGGEAAWRAEIRKLESAQRGLRDAVARLPEGRLHEDIPGQTHSYWHELLGILHHDLYHAGQISLLRKQR